MDENGVRRPEQSAGRWAAQSAPANGWAQPSQSMPGSHSTPAFGLRSWQAILEESNALSLSKGLLSGDVLPIGPISVFMPDLFPFVPCPDPVPGLAWIYLLQSADGSLYVGQTRDLRERTRKHRLGLGSKHTHDHAVPGLIYCEGPMALEKAVKRERQLKRWSRAKKLALIRGDIVELKQLSRSRS